MVNIVMQTGGQTNTGRQRMKERTLMSPVCCARAAAAPDPQIHQASENPCRFPARFEENGERAFTKRRIIDGDVSIEPARTLRPASNAPSKMKAGSQNPNS
jgi:hypothetical protein